MLQKVAVGRWSLDAYEGIVPDPILEELREHARALQGARILHVNATAYGGGVSELLRSARAAAARPRPDGRLEGDRRRPGLLPRHQGAAQRAAGRAARARARPSRPPTCDCVEENAATLDGGYDFIVIHDPQPAALLQRARQGQRALGVALSHRHHPSPTPTPGAFLAPVPRGLRRGGLHDARVRAARPAGRAGGDDRAGDRPAEPQEPRPRPESPPARSSTGSAWSSRDGSSRRSRASTSGRTRSA